MYKGRAALQPSLAYFLIENNITGGLSLGQRGTPRTVDGPGARPREQRAVRLADGAPLRRPRASLTTSRNNNAGTSEHTTTTSDTSDGGRAADVAQLGAERQVEVVDGVAAVRLEQARHAQQRHDGHLEGQRGAHGPPQPVAGPHLAGLRLVGVLRVAVRLTEAALPGLAPLCAPANRRSGSG